MMVRTVMDPVCQMEIQPEHAVAMAMFEGHRVFFCSEGCYGEFLDVPHRFVGWDDRPDLHRRDRRLRLGPR